MFAQGDIMALSTKSIKLHECHSEFQSVA
jgi:hypothetical protein